MTKLNAALIHSPSRAGPKSLFGLATVRGTGEAPGIVEITDWSNFSCQIRTEMPLIQFDHVCLRLGSEVAIETVVSWTCNGTAGLWFNGPVRLERYVLPQAGADTPVKMLLTVARS